MSGGSFDYLYYDAGDVAMRLRDVVEHAEGQYPEELVDDLEALADGIEDHQDVLRTIEWEASGDHGLETALEKVEEQRADE